MKNAIYPGSFDPITNGHLDIIKRASRMFDNVIVAVGINQKKDSFFSKEERLNLIKVCTEDLKNVHVQFYDGLTVNFCRENNINVIVRGVRNLQDFIAEQEIANLNNLLDKKIETVLLMSNCDYELISSSMVKEINHFGGNISKFVPVPVVDAFQSKKA